MYVHAELYDFQPLQSQLTFVKGGGVRACTRVEIKDDNFLEQEQQFFIRLELISSVPSFLLDKSIATVIIHDDDGELIYSLHYMHNLWPLSCKIYNLPTTE